MDRDNWCWIRPQNAPIAIGQYDHWSEDAKHLWQFISNNYQRKIQAMQTKTSAGVPRYRLPYNGGTHSTPTHHTNESQLCPSTQDVMRTPQTQITSGVRMSNPVQRQTVSHLQTRNTDLMDDTLDPHNVITRLERRENIAINTNARIGIDYAKTNRCNIMENTPCVADKNKYGEKLHHDSEDCANNEKYYVRNNTNKVNRSRGRNTRNSDSGKLMGKYPATVTSNAMDSVNSTPNLNIYDTLPLDSCNESVNSPSDVNDIQQINTAPAKNNYNSFSAANSNQFPISDINCNNSSTMTIEMQNNQPRSHRMKQNSRNVSHYNYNPVSDSNDNDKSSDNLHFPTKVRNGVFKPKPIPRNMSRSIETSAFTIDNRGHYRMEDTSSVDNDTPVCGYVSNVTGNRLYNELHERDLDGMGNGNTGHAIPVRNSDSEARCASNGIGVGLQNDAVILNDETDVGLQYGTMILSDDGTGIGSHNDSLILSNGDSDRGCRSRIALTKKPVILHDRPINGSDLQMNLRVTNDDIICTIDSNMEIDSEDIERRLRHNSTIFDHNIVQHNNAIIFDDNNGNDIDVPRDIGLYRDNNLDVSSTLSIANNAPHSYDVNMIDTAGSLPSSDPLSLSPVSTGSVCNEDGDNWRCSPSINRCGVVQGSLNDVVMPLLGTHGDGVCGDKIDVQSIDLIGIDGQRIDGTNANTLASSGMDGGFISEGHINVQCHDTIETSIKNNILTDVNVAEVNICNADKEVDSCEDTIEDIGNGTNNFLSTFTQKNSENNIDNSKLNVNIKDRVKMIVQNGTDLDEQNYCNNLLNKQITASDEETVCELRIASAAHEQSIASLKLLDKQNMHEESRVDLFDKQTVPEQTTYSAELSDKQSLDEQTIAKVLHKQSAHDMEYSSMTQKQTLPSAESSQDDAMFDITIDFMSQLDDITAGRADIVSERDATCISEITTGDGQDVGDQNLSKQDDGGCYVSKISLSEREDGLSVISGTKSMVIDEEQHSQSDLLSQKKYGNLNHNLPRETNGIKHDNSGKYGTNVMQSIELLKDIELLKENVGNLANELQVVKQNEKDDFGDIQLTKQNNEKHTDEVYQENCVTQSTDNETCKENDNSVLQMQIDIQEELTDKTSIKNMQINDVEFFEEKGRKLSNDIQSKGEAYINQQDSSELSEANRIMVMTDIERDTTKDTGIQCLTKSLYTQHNPIMADDDGINSALRMSRNLSGNCGLNTVLMSDDDDAIPRTYSQHTTDDDDAGPHTFSQHANDDGRCPHNDVSTGESKDISQNPLHETAITDLIVTGRKGNCENSQADGLLNRCNNNRLSEKCNNRNDYDTDFSGLHHNDSDRVTATSASLQVPSNAAVQRKRIKNSTFSEKDTPEKISGLRIRIINQQRTSMNETINSHYGSTDNPIQIDVAQAHTGSNSRRKYLSLERHDNDSTLSKHELMKFDNQNDTMEIEGHCESYETRFEEETPYKVIASVNSNETRFEEQRPYKEIAPVNITGSRKDLGLGKGGDDESPFVKNYTENDGFESCSQPRKESTTGLRSSQKFHIPYKRPAAAVEGVINKKYKQTNIMTYIDPAVKVNTESFISLNYETHQNICDTTSVTSNIKTQRNTNKENEHSHINNPTKIASKHSTNKEMSTKIIPKQNYDERSNNTTKITPKQPTTKITTKKDLSTKITTKHNINSKINKTTKPTKSKTSWEDSEFTISLPHTTNPVIHLDQLNECRCTEMEEEILACSQVLLTLQYSECMYQLNSSTQDTQASAVILAYVANIAETEDPLSDPSNGRLNVVAIPLKENSQAREMLCKVMSAPVRKVCYCGHEIISAILHHCDIPLADVLLWRLVDAEIATWLIDPDHPPPSFGDMIGQDTPVGNDSDIRPLLHHLSTTTNKLESHLKTLGMTRLFHEVEIPLIPILCVMELCPLDVDVELFMKTSKILEYYYMYYQKKLNKLEKLAHTSAGHTFCLNSHHQLRQVIFDELKLDHKLRASVDKTIGGMKSTSEAVLTQLQPVHDLPGIVLQYRQLQKVRSTYIDGMMTYVTNHQLSTHWDQTAAATGRLTSYHPNIQAIPKLPVTVSQYTDNHIIGSDMPDDSYDVYAREGFISRPGHSFVSCDYQQIELRMLTHLTNDPHLISIFTDPDSTDIFVDLTMAWLGKDRDKVTESDREQTKRVVYSIMYGAGKDKLGEYLKIKPDQARAVMDSFLCQFPSVNAFTKHCIDYCQRHGHTSTVLNRQRKFPQIHHSAASVRARTQRQAVNFCVQGSAADVCKVAMVHVMRALLSTHSHLNARLLVQIHDELLFDVPDEHVPQFKELLVVIMEDLSIIPGGDVKLTVPLKISTRSGKNWAHMTAE